MFIRTRMGISIGKSMVMPNAKTVIHLQIIILSIQLLIAFPVMQRGLQNPLGRMGMTFGADL
jgi:hypothetical protein